MEHQILTLLNYDQQRIYQSLRQHASKLLDLTPRFKYFTLHGTQHIESLLRISDHFLWAGLKLSQEDAFLLVCAICVHDLGMVVPLSEKTSEQIFGGKPQPAEPANIELAIRDSHHLLIDNYINQHFDFLTSLGLSPPTIALLQQISRCHRRIELTSVGGIIRSVGALLRVVDELDITPSRAPASLLLDNYHEMDATSCWHWFKHNICQEWIRDHNLSYEHKAGLQVLFKICVHPPRSESIPYWLTQTKRPIHRVLYDEGAARAISDFWGMRISVDPSLQLSSAMGQNDKWIEIEQKALSAGRKVILVVDDEVRKMEDLFLPLMQHFHVIFSSNTRDALDKLDAASIDLAILDLQVSSGFSWSPEETEDFKMTGLRLCNEIFARFPLVKVGILTGSRHELSKVQAIKELVFLIKKPVDPDEFEREVCRVLD
jgi:hypothetical protein